MARPDQVDHGHWHGKIVRVYPERAPTIHVGSLHPLFMIPITTPEDEQTKFTVKFCAEKGYKSGTVCKVVMVSRLGDCGLSQDLRSDMGYNLRVDPACLEEVPAEEAQELLRKYDYNLPARLRKKP